MMKSARVAQTSSNKSRQKASWVSKKTLIRVDHFTAWIAVPFLIASTVVYFVPSLPAWTQVFNLAFQVCFVVHTLISIYRFRVPKLRCSAKIAQIYSGYGVLLTVILNFVFYGQEPYATLVFWFNWGFVVLHLVIAVYFWLRRRR